MSTATANTIQQTFFTPKQIREARVMATQTKRSIAEVLEDQTGLPPKEFVAALGNL